MTPVGVAIVLVIVCLTIFCIGLIVVGAALVLQSIAEFLSVLNEEL